MFVMWVKYFYFLSIVGCFDKLKEKCYGIFQTCLLRRSSLAGRRMVRRLSGRQQRAASGEDPAPAPWRPLAQYQPRLAADTTWRPGPRSEGRQ